MGFWDSWYNIISLSQWIFVVCVIFYVWILRTQENAAYRYRTRHRVIGRVVDNYDIQIVVPKSGFLITTCT